MSRTKRSMRKFSSRKQNNHRQKKTRHTKYRKHRKIGKRNKSKRKSRKIFLRGGWMFTKNKQKQDDKKQDDKKQDVITYTITRKGTEQHNRRFEYIMTFLFFGSTNNLFIKNENLNENFDDNHKKNIYNNLKDIIFNIEDRNKYITKIYKYFYDIKNFPLFDEKEGELIKHKNTNYTTTIKMLEKIIDKDKLIVAIRKFLKPIDIHIDDIEENEDSISYVKLKDGRIPIIMSLIDNKYKYKYYLTLYTWLYTYSLTQKAEEAEAAAAAK